MDPQRHIEPALRLTAGLVLIYGFRNHDFAGLPLSGITFGEKTVWIRFCPDPLSLPEALGKYARQAAATRSIKRFGGSA